MQSKAAWHVACWCDGSIPFERVCVCVCTCADCPVSHDTLHVSAAAAHPLQTDTGARPTRVARCQHGSHSHDPCRRTQMASL